MGSMRRRFLIVALGASLGWAQQRVTLTAPPAKQGGTATVTVGLAGSSGVGIQWFIPAQAGATSTPGPAIPAGKTLTCAASAGLYGCMVVGGASPLADGVLATITFPAPAVGSLALPLTLVEAASATGDHVDAVSGAPLVLVTQLGSCDLNGDGKVDGLDVVMALQAAIARVTSAAMDLNGDGVVSVVDVQRVVVAASGGACRTGL